MSSTPASDPPTRERVDVKALGDAAAAARRAAEQRARDLRESRSRDIGWRT